MKNSKLSLNNNINCPDCDTPISVDKNEKIGSIIECSVCGAEIEILNLSPLKIALLEEEK